jgi:hypothetical protein
VAWGSYSDRRTLTFNRTLWDGALRTWVSMLLPCSQAFYLHIPITAHVRRTASNHRLVGYVFNARSWLIVVVTPIVFFLLRQKLVKCLVVSVENVKKGYINITFSNINVTLFSDFRVLHRESNQRPPDPLPAD